MSPPYVAVEPGAVELGDVVRRVGRPLQVGVVQGTEGELVLVRWAPGGPVDRRHHALLQRRVDRAEILL